MRNRGFMWVLIGAMVLLDIYVFQALKVVTANASPKVRISITVLYWMVSVLAIALLVLYPYLNVEAWPKTARNWVFAPILGLFLGKLVASLFIALDDIRRGVTWIITKIANNPSADIAHASDGITRSAFLSWLALGIGGTMFGTLLYGFGNKYRYHVNRIQLAFGNLPAAFKGLKIVHISDIHAGSFTDKQAVGRGIEKIMKEKPDLILFTGDLVNDRATEMDDYKEVFSLLKAPMGVYSTLGNHDYGDYAKWDNADAKKANLEQLKGVHKEMGWRLLMNEHVVLERGQDQIALLGIENWGKGTFSKYGKMTEAYPGSEKYPFKILLSHDPSHWDGEVRKLYNDIDLMLSGHTHGMQFGLELPGYKWSPAKYFYKQWAGLYESDKQKLYVNRGFGFLGYPGRVGILPEITVIELS